MTSNLHVCTRIYKSGDCVRELRSTENVLKWLDHNATYRFGLALVIDGLTKRLGYLTDNELDEAKRKDPDAFRPVDLVYETRETPPISY
jgi:hypothetical protein